MKNPDEEKHKELENRIKAVQNDIESMDDYLRQQLETFIKFNTENTKLIEYAKELLKQYPKR